MGVALRYNTASQEIPLGHFVDDADGVTAATGLTIANTDIKLWKAGATSLANKNSGGATHMAGGVYYATLDATDTNTIGPMVIFVAVSGALAVRLECHVYPQQVFDSLFDGAGDLLQVDVTQVEGSDATNQIRDAVVDDATRIDASALNTLSSHDPGETIMGATDLGTGAGLTSLATAAELAKVPKSDGTATWNATAAAQLQTEAADALAAYDPPTKAELDAAVAPLATAAALATVDNNVDEILTDTGTTLPGTLSTIAGYLDTEIAAIKDVTDKLDDTLEDDGGTYRFTANALEEAPSGGGSLTVQDIVDGVLDEAISGHLGAGSVGAAINAAGSAGDPWSTPIPGAYGSGTAGKIVGDALDAAISSRATVADIESGGPYSANVTQVDGAALDTHDAGSFPSDVRTWKGSTPGNLDGNGFVPANFAALNGNTTRATYYATAADNDILDAKVSTRASQTSVDDLPTNTELATALASADDAVLAAIATVDGNVDAVKDKTDQMTFTEANRLDVNVRMANSIAISGSGTPSDPWGPA